MKLLRKTFLRSYRFLERLQKFFMQHSDFLLSSIENSTKTSVAAVLMRPSSTSARLCSELSCRARAYILLPDEKHPEASNKATIALPTLNPRCKRDIHRTFSSSQVELQEGYILKIKSAFCIQICKSNMRIHSRCSDFTHEFLIWHC